MTSFFVSSKSNVSILTKKKSERFIQFISVCTEINANGVELGIRNFSRGSVPGFPRIEYRQYESASTDAKRFEESSERINGSGIVSLYLSLVLRVHNLRSDSLVGSS